MIHVWDLMNDKNAVSNAMLPLGWKSHLQKSDIHHFGVHDIKFCLLAWRDQPKSRDLVFHLRQIILTLERPDLGKVYAIYHLPTLLHNIKKRFTQWRFSAVHHVDVFLGYRN